MLIVLLPVTGQNIRFQNLNTSDGLSHSTVDAIFQDKTGRIWVGTYDGLNLYDGYKFSPFRNSPVDPNSISSNFISAIQQDTTGFLWIGTSNAGLNCMDIKTLKIRRFLTSENSRNSLSSNTIRSLWYDGQSTLWVGTNSGLNKLDIATQSITRIEFTDVKSKSVEILAICPSTNNQLWLGTTNGLYRYDIKTNTATRYANEPQNTNSLCSNRVQCISIDKQGYLWLGTSNGLDRCTIDDNRLIFTHFTANQEQNTALNSNNIRFIHETKKHGLWIGTDGGGLNVYNSNANTFTHFIPDESKAGSFSSLVASCILEDRSGILWLGSLKGGLNKFDPYSEKFIKYSRSQNTDNTFSVNDIKAIFRDNAGIVWLGTEKGGLNRFDRRNNQITVFTNNKSNAKSISDNVVLSLLNTSDNRGLWIGTYNGGLNKFDYATQNFTRYVADATRDGALKSNTVWVIYRDKLNRLWIGTWGAGINLFDETNGTFKSFVPPTSDAILSIAEDNKNNLWVGTYGGGLNYFDTQSKKFTTYTNQANDANSICNDIIVSLLYRSDNELWIGTANGFSMMDLTNKQFTNYFGEHGLPSNFINAVLIDKNGLLWLSTNNGLSKFNTQTKTFVNYDQSDGLQGNEFNKGVAFKASNGEMFFGGSNGFNSFYPDSLLLNTNVPPILITDFYLFNQRITPDDKGSVLTKIVSETDEIVLNYKQNFFGFEFVALNFTNTQKNTFKYKLENFDADWIEAGNQNRANYTNVSPGTYTFRVVGVNNDGLMNQEGAAIKIRIVPPFWRTIYFYSIILIISALLIFGFIKLRETKLRREREQLTALIQSRTDELQKQKDVLTQQKLDLEVHFEEQRIQNWISDGQTLINDIMSSNRSDIDQLSAAVVKTMTEYLAANQGCMVIQTDETDGDYLTLIAGYALNSARLNNRRFLTNEGLIGACFNDRKTIYLDNAPDNYSIIESGFGSVSAKYILLVPLKFEDTALGVIEFASIKPINDYKIKFVEKISETISYTIYILQINEKTSRLLALSKQQTEELLSREEELRQNMEELQATQDTFMKREQELRIDNQKLKYELSLQKKNEK